MSLVPIHCPHCGKTTRVDLAQALSLQKCDRCGVRLSAVDTGLPGSREIQPTEPPDWRRAKTGSWDDSPDDEGTSPAIPSVPHPGSRSAWITVGAALTLIAIAAIAIARRPVPPTRIKPMAASTNPATPPTSRSQLGFESLKAKIEAATAVAEQYLSARTVDDLLPLIENSAELEPRVRAYYSEGEGVGHLPLPEYSLAPVDRQLWVDAIKSVVISYETPGQVPRALALRQNPEGAWLIDWPSAAALSDMSLAAFKADRPTKPTFFRVLANRDDYYNHEFANDHEWLCLRLNDTTQDQPIFAYARRGTQLADQITSARLPRSPNQSPVMLRLRFPDRSRSNNQVEIVEFLGTGWIVEPPPSPAAAQTSPQ